MAYSPAPLRTPEDIVLAAPLMLGYWPADSLCAIVVDDDDRVILVMRWDHDAEVVPPPLPSGGAGEPRPARLHLVGFPPTGALDPAPWLESATALETWGVPLDVFLVAVRQGGDVMWTPALGVPGARTQRIIGGPQIHATATAWGLPEWADDREAFVSDIAPDAEVSSRLTAVLTQPGWVAQAAVDGGRDAAIARVRRHWDSDAPALADTARMLVDLTDVIVRDTVLWDLMHEDPRLWPAVADRLARTVAGAPERYVAPPATLLAILRWQLGDGSRASVAVERALAADPTYSLAALIERCLATGMHPLSWREGLASLSRDDCRRSA